MTACSVFVRAAQVCAEPVPRLREHANGWGCAGLEVELFAKTEQIGQLQLDLANYKGQLAAAEAKTLKAYAAHAAHMQNDHAEERGFTLIFSLCGLFMGICLAAVMVIKMRRHHTGLALLALLLASCGTRQNSIRYQDAPGWRMAQAR